MRTIIFTGVVAVACSALAAAPSFAHDVGFMWCKATPDKGTSSTSYYSDVFEAEPSETRAMEERFQSEAQKAKGNSTATFTAKCTPAMTVQTAKSALEAARLLAPGERLGWPG